jgi:dienelactone hydrolase
MSPAHVHRSQLRRAPIIVAMTAVALAGCSGADHYLIHPRQADPQIVTWSADFPRGELLVHAEGARPPGSGPFPTVIVHPEEDETAEAMRGVIWDLASHGYFAIALDYQRWLDGKYRRSTFAWRSAGDISVPIEVTSTYPQVDQHRIGALGFSEGAVLALLMAAYDPDRIKAVVAYYPITDFPRWYAGERGGLSPRILFALARWQLRVDSGAPNDDELQKMLRLASPYYMAEYLRAPVLLIHGADDTLAFPEESERMAEQLKTSGNTTTQLLLVPGAGRLFNFHQPQQATVAWDAALQWLERYLKEKRLAANFDPGDRRVLQTN